MTSEVSLGLAPAMPVSPAAKSSAPPLQLPGNRAPAAVAATDVLTRAAQRVADSLGSGNSFSFTVDRETGMTIVKVINKATGELVRQIPSEEVVHIAQLLKQDEHQPVLDVRV
jgi:flagellar protein FlaG